MKLVRKPPAGTAAHGSREGEQRLHEVLRAKKTLDAYFKGTRTDREARAALKIIKAFVRDRERQDPKRRLPLAGGGAAIPIVGRRHTRKRRPVDRIVAVAHDADESAADTQASDPRTPA